MKRTIRVFSLLLAAVMLLSAQALATEPAQAVTDVEHILGNIYVDCRA